MGLLHQHHRDIVFYREDQPAVFAEKTQAALGQVDRLLTDWAGENF